MCGIVCYVGKNKAEPILIEGLKRLEYRGYDSAGIAVQDGRHIDLPGGTSRANRITGFSVVVPTPAGGGFADRRPAGDPGDAGLLRGEEHHVGYRTHQH